MAARTNDQPPIAGEELAFDILIDGTGLTAVTTAAPVEFEIDMSQHAGIIGELRADATQLFAAAL